MHRTTFASALLGILFLNATVASAVDILVGPSRGNVVAVAGTYTGPCQLIVTRAVGENGKPTGMLEFQPVLDSGTTVNGSTEPFLIEYPGERGDLIVDVRLVPISTVTLFNVNFLNNGAGDFIVGDDIVVYSDSEVRLFDCASGWTTHGEILVQAPDVTIQDCLADTNLTVQPYRGNAWRRMEVEITRTHVGFGDGGTLRVFTTEGNDGVRLAVCSATSRVEIGLGGSGDRLSIGVLDTPFLKAFGDGGNDNFFVEASPEIDDFDLQGGSGTNDRLLGYNNPYSFTSSNTNGFEAILNN